MQRMRAVWAEEEWATKQRKQTASDSGDGSLQILEWVEKYGANHKTSGQICFDFMLNKSDGKMYCIECALQPAARSSTPSGCSRPKQPITNTALSAFW